MVVLLTLGAIAMAGCGGAENDDIEIQEDPLGDPGAEEEDSFAEPDPLEDPGDDSPF